MLSYLKLATTVLCNLGGGGGAARMCLVVVAWATVTVKVFWGVNFIQLGDVPRKLVGFVLLLAIVCRLNLAPGVGGFASWDATAVFREGVCQFSTRAQLDLVYARLGTFRGDLFALAAAFS